MRRAAAATLILAAAALCACGDNARYPVAAGVGPDPALPPSRQALVPTVNVAPATGWPAGTAPIPAPGLKVASFASGLDHPRWLLVLPNGDVLVAETNAQPKPTKGLRGVLHEAGDDGRGRRGAERRPHLAPSRRRHDGAAETRTILLDGLTSPFGMALVGNALYVADTDALLRFPYTPGQTRITAPATRVAGLPAGEINHHWTKGLAASPDGRTLYVSVGSNSDHGENGMAAEAGRAAIWAIDPATRRDRGLCRRPAQPGRPGFRAGHRHALDRRQRARRARRRPRARLPDLGPPGATSTAGPTATTAATSIHALPPQRPDLVARARSPTTRSGRTARRWASPSPTAPSSGRGSARGRSSGCTDRGTASRRSGYEVIFVPFRNGRPGGEPLGRALRLRRRRRRCARPPGRRGARPERRAPGGRRRRQRGLARDMRPVRAGGR